MTQDRWIRYGICALLAAVLALAMTTAWLAGLKRGEKNVDAAGLAPSRIQAAGEDDLQQAILFWNDTLPAYVQGASAPGVARCQAGKYRYVERYLSNGLVVEAWGEVFSDSTWQRHGLTTFWDEGGKCRRRAWYSDGSLEREDLPGSVKRMYFAGKLNRDEFPGGRILFYEDGKPSEERMPDGTTRDVHYGPR